MNVFGELLAIKRFREGQAELAVARQRQALADAERQQARAREQLDEYRAWSRQRELDMYRELCGRLVRVRDIEDVMQGVADLRQGERDRETRAEQAAEQARHEAEALAGRRQAHREASRLVEKFVQLASLHAADELRELERREDLEMEEAASVSRDRDDWQQHEEYEPA
ncbi:type III secretion protein [Castellaniella defragrans]|uniref:Type III secretion protein O n=1 Tax=Castellaniella defragrans TaxID=75697 RepID=A0A7W9WPV2_CASDE|nr:type III secretion protein [Castellaniella defragrans]KAB0596018.1 type III secretion protein [Castellaniella defragrans]MBB6084948.1 type III secretion protein O [Castellaniella defragrans]